MVIDIERYFRKLKRNLQNNPYVDDVNVRKANHAGLPNIEKREFNVYLLEDNKDDVIKIAKEFEQNLHVETKIVEQSSEPRYNKSKNSCDIIVTKMYSSAS